LVEKEHKKPLHNIHALNVDMWLCPLLQLCFLGEFTTSRRAVVAACSIDFLKAQQT
jgi:hypothetical protein